MIGISQKMKYFISFIVVCICLIVTATSEASWFFYHKPEFDGQILDVDTKEPIEGAVIEVRYEKLIYGIMGHGNDIFHIEETLTDKEGRFHFSTYNTLINPLTFGAEASILIYKPGYALEFGFEEQFSSKSDKWKEDAKSHKINNRTKYHDKILELPKLESGEERKRAMPSLEYEKYLQKEQKLLFKTLNEERKYLGLPLFTKP